MNNRHSRYVVPLGTFVGAVVVVLAGTPLWASRAPDLPETLWQRSPTISLGSSSSTAPGLEGSFEPLSGPRKLPPADGAVPTTQVEYACPPTPGFGSDGTEGPGGWPGQSRTVPQGYPTPT